MQDRPHRNRTRPPGSLEQRLQKFVDEARAAAAAAPPGPLRDALTAKAEKAQRHAAAARRLNE